MLTPQNTFLRVDMQRFGLKFATVAVLLFGAAGGCAPLKTPGMKSLDLMSPSTSILSPFAKHSPKYRYADGSPAQMNYPADGSMTMETYQKIREAKAQNAVVLQVANDSEPIRVLPLPPGEKTAFVSELLGQTGLLNKLDRIEATVYRPTPNSIEGAKMDIVFVDEDTIDPTTDYSLRPGDRIQVTEVSVTPWESLTNAVLRR
ncbi:hypothetical protein [Roseiconus lacunae]|uniref:DUF3313 domain-containing protein n=1 Tax=Roseiconus lacunae TaxID=2605694 RepID=A0ABT7PI60_9BACT|nr:hypothetical protein [Roseiconus lacunae]MCD0461356.1 hypothetical protein [Roseiconus lacunae]MDM4016183.1 hypothetical protein [Roseiconus lacunae]WRQ51481.1 hypothetical protein U8335_02850 [Stieleria sp. HD01]